MFIVRTIFNNNFKFIPDYVKQQTRNTFILKRRFPPNLTRKGGRGPKMRSKHFIYDLVEDTTISRKQPDISIILKQFVDGHGYAGDVLSMKPFKAYNHFILPGLAVYASPENKEKYEVDKKKSTTELEHSSPYVPRTISILSRKVLYIYMNKTHPWKLEPWHIRASFRTSGFVVPEYAIEMPPIEIKGPDLSLQDKEFFITVTINNKEKVNVRCRIHHWAIGIEEIPLDKDAMKMPKLPLIPEQAEVLENMPLQE